MDTCNLLCAIKEDIFMKDTILGVFPRDKVPQHRNNRGGYILNTAPSNHPGLHWLAVFYESQPNSVEMFDSFAQSPAYYQLNECNNKSFKYLKFQVQDDSTPYCGYYALMFLYMRSRHYSFEDVVNNFSDNLVQNDLLVYDFIKTRFSFCVGDKGHLNQTCKYLT